MSSRKITILGGGQAGLQLACGLLQKGYEVKLVQNRTAEDIRTGKVMSSQCMFDAALQNERDIGLDFWAKECPTVDSINFVVPAPDGSGNKAIDWNGMLDRPAQSVDQRTKYPVWMQEFERRGGTLEIREATIADLEGYAAASDLTIVAAGKGDIAKLFERDAEKSPFDKPQRALALTYLHGMTPRPDHSAVNFNLIPTVGEYFVFPALTNSGACDIMVFEGIPGGPMDCWKDVDQPAAASRALEMDPRHVPALGGRALPQRRADRRQRHPRRRLCADGAQAGRPAALRQAGARTGGRRLSSTTRSPGKARTTPPRRRRSTWTRSSRMAIGRFDAAFMQATFDRYWDYAQYVTGWTNALLQPPPPHVLNIMGSAQAYPVLARRIANGFDNPLDLFPWFAVPEEADRYLQQLAA